MEDELFILKTYLNIKEWGIDSDELNNLIFAGNINEVGPFYLDSSNYKDFLKGQYNQEDEQICSRKHKRDFNKLSEFLLKLFTKYYYWKNKTFVNVEYLYIATYTGCFFKFPAIKSSWAQKNFKVSDVKLICPNREPNDYFEPIKDNNIYSPRCRHFY